MTTEGRKDFIINVIYIGMILLITALAARFMFGYLLPFIIGAAVALAVQRPAAFCSDKTGIKKPVCALVITVLICGLAVAGTAVSVWTASGRIALLISNMPQYYSAIGDWANGVKNSIIDTAPVKSPAFESALSGVLGNISERIAAFASDTAAAIVKGIPAFLISSVVTIVASFYIAKDFDRLKKFATGIIPPKTAANMSKLKRIILQNTKKFIKGYGIIALITFIELSALFAILGIKDPVLKALIVSLVDALPVLGVGTVIIPWAVIELLRRNFYIGFGLIIGFAVIIVIRNFLEPKIIGDQIGINPLFTLLSMFLGLKIAGIAGMILFPLALTVAVEYYKSDMRENIGNNAN